jgi:phosphopantetheinyl transferase (holo-ACP synthase)
MSIPETPVKIETIDITPTWGEIMQQYIRFAESGEKKVVLQLRSEVAKAAAAAQALHEIRLSLTDEQTVKVNAVVLRELAKMGF